MDKNRRIAIVGGGLAGCALAYELKQNGAVPVIYESSSDLAQGASGNSVGLYNPRFTAQLDYVGEFYSSAFKSALNIFESLGKVIDWSPCGALHLITNEQKARRFPKTVESWGWDDRDMRILSPQEASEVAGIEIPYECLYLRQSGYVSPRKLCHAYAKGVEVKLNHVVEDLDALEEDVVVLAAGMGCLKFRQASHLPLKAVRGQVSFAEPSEETASLKTALCYGGYTTPVHEGAHCVGATFQRWLDHDEVLDGDDSSNLDMLHDVLPTLSNTRKVVDRRAAVRTTSKDHFPIVGQLEEGVFINTAHGSHGIISTALSAKILSNYVVNTGFSCSSGVLSALCPSRFS